METEPPITFDVDAVMARASEALDEPELGPAELLFLAYVLAGMAAWLAYARWWRWL